MSLPRLLVAALLLAAGLALSACSLPSGPPLTADRMYGECWQTPGGPCEFTARRTICEQMRQGVTQPLENLQQCKDVCYDYQARDVLGANYYACQDFQQNARNWCIRYCNQNY